MDLDAAPSPTPPAASDLHIYDEDHSVPRAKQMRRELSDSRARTPSPASSENLNLNTDQQKVSYHYWLCYCTDQDVGCKNLVFQICCKT